MYKDYSEGGVRMINVKVFINALKTSWLRKMILYDRKCLKITGWQNEDFKYIHVLGAEYILTKLHSLGNPFWKDVYTSYYSFKKSCVPILCEKIKCEHLFYNNNIKIGGKFIYRKKFIEKGIYTINDLLNKNGTFFSFKDFVKIHGNITNYLEYASILSSVKAYLTKIKVHNLGDKLEEPLLPFTVSILIQAKKKRV